MVIENPTIEQRRTIKNLIYLIFNLTNFRCYVGFLEHLYATIYDCYYPYGYNIAICGRKEDYRDSIERGRIKNRELIRKYPLKDRYEFISPKDIIYKVREDKLSDFYKEHNIKDGFLTYLTFKIYNGWRLLENKHIKPIEKNSKI